MSSLTPQVMQYILALRDQMSSTLEKAGANTQQFERKAKSSFQSTGTLVDQLKSQLGGLVSVWGAMRIGRYLVDVNSEVEGLELRLVGLKGGVDGAKQAMAEFRTVAAKVPFDLGAVANAGVQIEAFGASASDALLPVTDLAAFMGVDLPMAAQAFGRAWAAGAGAADVLRERGLLNIIKLRTGIEDVTKLTLPEFRKALMDTMVDPSGPVAGAATRMASTIKGQWSMLTDETYKLANAIGDAGVTAALKGMISVLKDAAKAGRGLFNMFAEQWGGLSQLVGSFTTGDLEEVNRASARLVAGLGDAWFGESEAWADFRHRLVEAHDLAGELNDASTMKGAINGAGPSAMDDNSPDAALFPGDETGDYDAMEKRIAEVRKRITDFAMSETDRLAAKRDADLALFQDDAAMRAQVWAEYLGAVDELELNAEEQRRELDEQAKKRLADDVKAREERLARLLEQNMTEEERQIARFDREREYFASNAVQLQAVEEWHQQRLQEIRDKAYEQQMAGYERDHNAWMAGEQRREREEKRLEREKKQRMAEHLRLQRGFRSALVSITETALGEEHSISRSFAIANAIMNTREGITEALTLPWPKSLWAAARVAATGFAEVKRIKDTKPGGGGSMSFGGGGAGGSSEPATPEVPMAATAPEAAAPQTTYNIHFQGSTTDEAKRELIGFIEEEGLAGRTKVQVVA